MGTCFYCGRPAGFLHNRHPECEEMHTRGLSDIKTVVSTATSEQQRKNLSARIQELAGKSWISGDEYRTLLLTCWCEAVEKRLDRGLLTAEDETHLFELASALALSKDDLVETNAFLRLHSHGVAEIRTAVSTAAAGSKQQLEALSLRIEEVAAKSWITAGEREDLLLKCWSEAVEKRLDNGLLTAEDDNQLKELASALSLSTDALVKTDSFLRVVKAAVLRDLSAGIVPERCTVTEALPFALQNDERVVWAFANTKYIEDKVHHRSAGGQPSEYTVHSPLDIGWFVVTDTNLYFAGAVKSLRLPLKKIVSFKKYSDGLGVTREGSNARPHTFTTGDGWFTYSLVSKLVGLVGKSRSRGAHFGQLAIDDDRVGPPNFQV